MKAVFQDRVRAFQSGLEEIFERKGEEPSFLIRDEMKSLMTSQVGLFRNEPALLAAKEKTKELRKRFLRIGLRQRDLAFNNEFIQYWELEGMLHLAEVVVEGALARKESRGSHFRADYPKRDDEHWLCHTLAFKTAEGVTLDYKGVAITSYPPKERTY
jgi:succinate dehydrogenase / fumarate reductase flavoprotein subunit